MLAYDDEGFGDGFSQLANQIAAGTAVGHRYLTASMLIPLQTGQKVRPIAVQELMLRVIKKAMVQHITKHKIGAEISAEIGAEFSDLKTRHQTRHQSRHQSRHHPKTKIEKTRHFTLVPRRVPSMVILENQQFHSLDYMFSYINNNALIILYLFNGLHQL